MTTLLTFIGNIVKFIIQPLVGLLFALALFMFVYGIIPLITNPGDPEIRKKGRSHLLWGIIGLVIMVGVMGFLSVVTKTFGVNLPQ